MKSQIKAMLDRYPDYLKKYCKKWQNENKRN